MALTEADYGLTQMAIEGQQARFKDDDQLLVRFYTVPRQNMERSKEEGRPIFEEKEYVSIMSPGSRDGGVARPAREGDKERFSEHYAKFKARQDQQVLDGTPLSEWPAVTRSMVEELKFFNVFTVEQLANMSDSNLQNFMGLGQFRERARTFLEASKDNAVSEMLSQAQTDNERLTEQVAELSARVADLTERLLVATEETAEEA